MNLKIKLAIYNQIISNLTNNIKINKIYQKVFFLISEN